MAWRSIDQHIETLRDRLATDPEDVYDQVEMLLEHGRHVRPADRLRLLGLLVASCRKRGAFEEAEKPVVAGMKINTPSRVARSDFLLQTGALRMVQGRAEEALALINCAGGLLAQELEKPPPRAKESLRRRRWIEATKGASLVLRGEVFYHLSVGTIEEAFADAVDALRLTSRLVKASSHTRRVHLAAVTLLSNLVVRFRSSALVRKALTFLDHADQTLMHRCRAPATHIHRIKLKWGRAVALARLGDSRKAERMLIDVIERLIAGGFYDDGQKALEALMWVIKQTRFPERASYMLVKYSRRINEAQSAC